MPDIPEPPDSNPPLVSSRSPLYRRVLDGIRDPDDEARADRVGILGRLVALEQDAASMCEAAAAAASARSTAEAIEELAQQHRSRADAIGAEVRRQGGSPPDDGEWDSGLADTIDALHPGSTDEQLQARVQRLQDVARQTYTELRGALDRETAARIPGPLG